MVKKPLSRYARCVCAFAASAIAILVVLSAEMQAANTMTAAVAGRGLVLTNYTQLCGKNINGTTDTHRLQAKVCSNILRGR